MAPVDVVGLLSGLRLGGLALQLHEVHDVERRLPGDDAVLGVLEPALVAGLPGAAEHAADDGETAQTKKFKRNRSLMVSLFSFALSPSLPLFLSSDL